LAKLNETAEFSDDYPAANAPVKFVRLDGLGRMGFRFGDPVAIAIASFRTGDLLVSSSGYEYDFRHTRHHGLFDFYVLEHMDNEDRTRHEYQFDGKVYQQVDSIDEPYN
jgi:hypothetical protein